MHLPHTVIVLLAFASVPSFGAETPMTPQGWRDDLRFLAGELPKRHKNAFHTVTREQFHAAVDALDAKLPGMRDHEAIVGFTRVVAMVGDGHTIIETPRSFRTLPLTLYRFGDELRVTSAVKTHERVLGMRLVAIGQTPVEEAWRRVLELVPHGENEQFLRWRGASLMQYFEVLHALSLTGDADLAKLTFADDAGRQTSVDLRPADAGERVSAAKKTPLYRRQQGDVSFTYLPEHRTLYFRFDGYPPFPEMKRFADQLFSEFDRKPVARFVIDLRQNAGGDFLRFRLTMLGGIRERAGSGKPVALYAITGRRTFSAAMVNAIDLRKAGATLVGEPTGGRPNGYSENESLVLPNSRLAVGYSTMHYRFADDADDAVKPDHPAPITWPDYAAGRDAALEWILAQPVAAPATSPAQR